MMVITIYVVFIFQFLNAVILLPNFMNKQYRAQEISMGRGDVESKSNNKIK